MQKKTNKYRQNKKKNNVKKNNSTFKRHHILKKITKKIKKKGISKRRLHFKNFRGGGINIDRSNYDGFGFKIANLLSDNFGDCDCSPVDQFVPNLILFGKILNITFGKPTKGIFSTMVGENITANFGTIGLNRQVNEVFCISNFLNNNALYIMKIYADRDSWTDRSVSGALTKYTQWVLFHIASVIYVTSALGGTRGERVKIRFMFDNTNWEVLSSISRPTRSPILALATDILQNDVKDYPIQSTNDANTVAYIKKVVTEFINVAQEQKFDNLAHELIMLFYIGANLFAYNNENQRDIFTNKEKNKLEVFLYDVPSFHVKKNGIPSHGNSESIGQIIRFLSLVQTPYKTTDGMNDVVPPYAVHMRDGHASCASSNSYYFENDWLNSPYRYLSGHSLHYTFGWHEQRKGMFAGFFSGKRDEGDESIMPIYQWKNTFGRAFCGVKSNPGFIKVCPTRTFNKESQYGYGIDEFAGSYMYLDERKMAGWQEDCAPYLKEIFDNTLYVQIMWFGHIGLSLDCIINDFYYTKRKSQREIQNIYTDLVGRNHMGTSVDIRIVTPEIQIFHLQQAALIRLIFNCFYYMYKNKYPAEFARNGGVSWLNLKTYMYETTDALNGITATPNRTIAQTEAALNEFNPNPGYLSNISFAFLILLVPPIYAFFNSLFNNSDNADNFTRQKFVPYNTEENITKYINDFSIKALTPNTGQAVLVKYYKKLYSIYQVLNSIRDGNGDKNSRPGWDLRQWYNPNDDVTITLSPNLQEIIFN